MAWFAKPKSKKEQIEEQRRRRRGDTVVLSVHWLNFQHLLGAFLFVVMAVAVTFISFVGLSPATQQLVANQRERVRVVASFKFDYTSAVLTERAKKLAGEQVPPSFHDPDHALEDRMKQAVLELETALDQYQKDAAGQTPQQQLAAREKYARDFNAKQGFDLSPSDIAGLTASANSAQRAQVFNEALATVHSLLNRGIFDSVQPGVLAPDEALRQFHLSLVPLDVDGAAKAAIYNLLKQTLAPNIQFDQERTERAKTAAMDAVPPAVVQVSEGQVLADPNAPAYDPDEQSELLTAYFKELRQHNGAGAEFNHLLMQRFVATALLLLAAMIFISSGLAHLDKTPKAIALAAVLLLINLALLRAVLGLGSTNLFVNHPAALSVLPWIAPTMLASMLATVMIGAAPAVLVALLTGILFAMMTGDTLEVFLINLLASLVAVYFSREVRVRARLVRAGLLGGAVAALGAAYLGLLNQSALTNADVGRQMFAAICLGPLTAVVAIGLLPILENLFKITTDIRLLELTDFNHPLLRKLQYVAPGTYHHSLMVANLAERAAAEVGANSLLCRACSLYHDIGKMIKPEYFNENQRDGFNPHEEVGPSMSALIIKSHVTEGLDLARQYKLPRVLQDAIVQHHGTTLIKFFYHKAARQQKLLTQTPFSRQRAAQARANAAGKPAPAPEDPALDQSFYRYDGPKPNFKESAIIALADSIEAASRALRKVTPQSVEELIESIVNDRIEDHQLDDSPITILELKRIKQSFTVTLLNMLHSRVQYPGQDESGGSAPERETPVAPISAPTSVSTMPPTAAADNATPKIA